MNLLILVVDAEADVELLFRQHFRRDLGSGRFSMVFPAADMAAARINEAAYRVLILVLSDINVPGMSGLEPLPKVKSVRPDVPIIMITEFDDGETKHKALEGGAEALLAKQIDFGQLRIEIDSRVERVA